MRGQTLASLLDKLKMELGDADESNTATDNRYYKLLANKQSDLANMYDWSFLSRQWDLSVYPGDRYKDIPTQDIRGTAAVINFERPLVVDVYFNTFYEKVFYGVGPAEYNYRNSDLNEQQDPVMRWAMNTNAGESTNANQLEIWPIPATAQTLRFVGQRQIADLLVTTDKADLDDLLIVYGVAAEQLALRGQTNAPLVLRKFNERLLRLRGGMPSCEEPIKFGYQCHPRKDLRPIVIAGNVAAGGATANSFSGASDIPINVDEGVVVFNQTLSFTPAVATLTVAKESGALNLFATIVAGSLTTSGFSYTLSGITDTDAYDLNFIVSP